MGKKRKPAKRADRPAADLKERQREFYGHFAANVIAARQAKGMSQIDLANKAGLARAYVSKVERQAITCNVFAALRIARALGVKLDRLCRES